MLELSFSSNLKWGSYITSIAKTTSKEIRDCSVSLNLPMVFHGILLSFLGWYI